MWHCKSIVVLGAHNTARPLTLKQSPCALCNDVYNEDDDVKNVHVEVGGN